MAGGQKSAEYLKGTSTYSLLLDGNLKTATYEAYIDGSLASQPKERKTITRYVISIDNVSISLCSSKQGSVSIYTGETELIALSEWTEEGEEFWYILRQTKFH